MTILQSGKPKSGNYWIWQIIQNIITEAGLSNKSFIQQHPIYPLAQTWELSFKEQAGIDVLDIEHPVSFYRISSIFRMPIDDIDAYLAQGSHIWTHSVYEPRCEDIYRKFDHIVYLIRDPRDVLISRSKFLFAPYTQKHFPTTEADVRTAIDRALEDVVREWVRQVARFLMVSESLNVHVAFYEQFNRQFDLALNALLDYLKIELDDEALARIRHNVAFSTMKQANPDHVKKGQAYDWVETFTPAQKQRTLHIAGPMLEYLGYPIHDGDAGSSIPQAPTTLDEKQIRQFLAGAVNASQPRFTVRKIFRALKQR